MKNMRIHCVSSAGCLACLRLVATLTLQSALLLLQAQSPVLYSFAGGTSDGSEPDGNLVISAGSLYGTTGLGGASGDGTVFKLKFSAGTWTESVIYNFAGGTSDGSNPYAGLLLSGGVFYGTTFYGGAHGDGTVFSLTPSGSSWAEYSGGSSSDGTVFSLTP